MTTAMTATTPVGHAATILERSVCLTLACHYLGNHRQARLGEIIDVAGGEQGVVDERSFHVTKRLIDPKEINPVLRVQEQMKAFLRSRAIAAHRVFGDRTYLVPVADVEAIDDGLCALERELRQEAAALADRYASAVARQAVAHGPLFRASDYPDPAHVATAFQVEWSYVSFAAPERLETVNRALFEGARARYETKLGEAYEEVRQVLRETLRELVGAIAAKLTPGADGKPKVFRSTILDGLTGFLETFRVRNLTDDAALEAVVQQLKGLTAGIDPQQLRDLEIMRTTVLAGVQAAATHLDGLVATGRRAMGLFGGAAAE